MNRNIITVGDLPRSPFESITPKADDFWTRLVKYVPLEIIGAYLAISGVAESALQGMTRRAFLGVLLLLGGLAVWFFARNVLAVVRRLQLGMSVLAFVIWVLATGGFFATFPWWHPWHGTVAVVAFGVAVKIIDVGPLPDEPKAR